MIQFPMQKIGITAEFGPYTVSGVKKPHNGCDICAQSDRTVCAAHGGEVLASFYDAAGGNMVVVQGEFNEKSDVITRYAHLAARTVKTGERVARGQKLGEQGETGSACFGRHLHFETWLVPKGYTYRYTDRSRYSVDPLSVCHLMQGQSFICDADTNWLRGIPYPEPAPDKLRALADGSSVEVQNGAVRVRLVPWTAFPPLVSNSTDRSRDTLGEWWPQGSFPAKYTCETTENGSTQRWAMIDTPLGLWWVALLAGYTALREQPGSAAQESPDPQQPQSPTQLEKEVERLGAELTRVAALAEKQQTLLAQTAEIWAKF